MKSSLKIALHGTNEPMILASVATDRDDLRDDVMNKFFDSLTGPYTEPNNTQEKSYLAFVEGFGREKEPESYIYTIHPIPPNEEDRFINRLQLSQAERIIKLAFQMFDNIDRQRILEQLNVTDMKLGSPVFTKGLNNPQEIGVITGKKK